MQTDSETATAFSDKQPRVVIIGGGFAGLAAARALRHAPLHVTLVDKRNYHLFQPLLYQVATGDLSPANIASPLRVLLRSQRNCRIVLGEVTGFDVSRRRVQLLDGELQYDYLVVASGASFNYFGHDEWSEHAPGLKSIEDATQIRRKILFALEAADRESEPERRRGWLTFVIAGAGPTGVEMAGAISEITRHALKHDFRSLRNETPRIVLVEGLPSVLPPYPDDLSQKAERALRKLGVDVVTNTFVTEVAEDHVVTERKIDEEQTESQRIATHTVVWAAGVQASPLGEKLAEATKCSQDRSGRLQVAEDLSLPGYPEIFVAGDLACYTHQGDEPLPGLAPVAIQEGEDIGNRLKQRAKGEPELPPFHYKDRGSMAVIGRYSAVGVVGKRHLSGVPAWLIWLLIHLLELTQFRNRVLVMIQWGWSFLTRDRSARLITGDLHELLECTRSGRAEASETQQGPVAAVDTTHDRQGAGTR